MFGEMNWSLGSFVKPDLRTLVISAAAIGLSGALMATVAIANHKDQHNPGGGGGGGDDGGGDVRYDITLTNDVDGAPIAAGEGVDGAGGTIDGITGGGSFESIALASISTDGSITADANVQADYNEICKKNENVFALDTSEDIDDIRVVHDAEIDTITVAVDYTVTEDGETQAFTLLLQGPDKPEGSDEAVFPPTERLYLTDWNNRGGGKGKKNRCGTGPRDLDLVALDIVEQP